LDWFKSEISLEDHSYCIITVASFFSIFRREMY